MHSSAGLDLGSHRLRLAAAGTIVPLDGQVSSVPCVVEPGRGAMCVVSLKRALASPESGVQEASVEAQLLNRLKSIRAAAGASRLVIAVPGSFSQHRRAKLRELAVSTFDGVRLIDDASAALHGTSLSGARERICVLSWGSWGCEAVAFGGEAGLRMIALEHDVDIGADAFDSQTLSDALRGSNTGDVASLYTAARGARESVLAGTTAPTDERVDINDVRRRVDDSIDRALGLLTKAIGNGADAVFVMGSIATAPALLERLRSVNGALKPMADADAARGASLHAAALPESSWSVPAPAATPAPAPPAATRPSSATKPPARRPIEAERGPKKVARVGRNDKCPCGSGRKYKKCHGA